jgi:dTDP-4-dehydrorhamnose reductase
MNILVIGCNGQLGKDMVSTLTSAGHSVSQTDFPAIDIADPESVAQAVKDAPYQAVINCAAFTAVDACETRKDDAYAVNAIGVRHIAEAARTIGAKVLHFSTDYVFDGMKNVPYVESDAPNPKSVYGQSKLEGERLLVQSLDNHIILRVAWLYGIHGQHFIKKIKTRALSLKGTGQALNVVTDEIGTPTYTLDVCRQTLELLKSNAQGLFHCTNEGFCTRFEFAQEIIKAYGPAIEVKPCLSKDFPLPAPRPAYGVLENKRLKDLGINVMRDWKVAFGEYVQADL